MLEVDAQDYWQNKTKSIAVVSNSYFSTAPRFFTVVAQVGLVIAVQCRDPGPWVASESDCRVWLSNISASGIIWRFKTRTRTSLSLHPLPQSLYTYQLLLLLLHDHLLDE